jgi:transcriptional regulator with XRE-family HTH domain
MMNIEKRHLYMIMRKEKKIKHIEIANAIGVSQSAISQYETGKINLKHKTRLAYEQYIENK